jgi:hypothetical protein
VTHGMILEHELACERSIAIERHGRGAIEPVSLRARLLLPPRHCSGQQGERGFLCHVVMLRCMGTVHRVDGVPRHVGDGLPAASSCAR